MPGAYFITVLAYRRTQLFGTLVKGEVKLSEYGKIAKEEWFNTAIRRLYVTLNNDEIVIMPDHIHGIIWINDHTSNQSRGAASLRPYTKSGFADPNVIPRSLGAIIRANKSAVTCRINLMRNSPGERVWHRNSYDHIIRDEAELRKIRDYIAANPQQGAEHLGGM